jgi:hypothetical protein
MAARRAVFCTNIDKRPTKAHFVAFLNSDSPELFAIAPSALLYA